MRTYIVCAIAALFLSTGCKTIILPQNSAKAPPVQVKKATGAQSAKAYAPGQQKNRSKKN